MDHVLNTAVRRWIAERHLTNVLELCDWLPMFDSDGNELVGIRGRRGVGEQTVAGIPVGADLIELQPGAAFPPHEHPGDHILYFVSGRGEVLISREWKPVKGGDLIFIAAEHPHAVKGPPPGDTESLVIVAFGYPHEHVDSKHRMHHPMHE